MDKSPWQKIDTAISVLMRRGEVNVAVLLGEARDEILSGLDTLYKDRKLLNNMEESK